jgi:outer membrane protein insertion porin family
MTTELFFETERETKVFASRDYSLGREAATFQQTKRLTDSRSEKFSLQWNFQFARYEGETIDRAGRLLTVATNRPRFGFSIIEDRRDSFANPSNGRFWNVTLQVVPRIWGSSVSYYRLYGQFFYYKPLFGSMVWASGYRAGIAQGTEEVLVIDDRFHAGGANSVRGFEQNSLGPTVTDPDTGERYFLGGQAVGVFNQELRFPLYKSLAAGVFWDAGNVFTRASDFQLSTFRHSLGAGIRYLLPFGAVRLDWAHVLNRREGDRLVDFHFSFGMAF